MLFHTSPVPRNNGIRRLTSLDGFNSNNPLTQLKYATRRSTFREIGPQPVRGVELMVGCAVCVVYVEGVFDGIDYEEGCYSEYGIVGRGGAGW